MGFKAIVCHDGITDTRATWFVTEELYFAEHDLGGTPWEAPAEFEKWNPLNHIKNWKTVRPRNSIPVPSMLNSIRPAGTHHSRLERLSLA